MKEFITKARGGRVVQTPFLELEDQDELRRLAKAEGLQLEWFGGLPLAERKVGVLFPPEVPQVSDPTQVLFVAQPDPEVLEDQLRALLSSDLLGDLQETEGGCLLVTVAKGVKELQGRLQATPATPQQLPKSREKVRSVVVPSLRVDVVGAKGFGVSRTYFAQGVKAGKVKLAGRTASGKDEIKEGDTLVAEGLGVLEVRRVLGATKRGNLKLELEVHR